MVNAVMSRAGPNLKPHFSLQLISLQISNGTGRKMFEIPVRDSR